MALIKCHECGTEVSTEAKTCPKCGATVRSKSNKVMGVVSVLVVLGAVWYFFGGGMEQEAARNMATIESNVAADAVRQYQIAKKSGNPMDSCVQAGFVSAAYLQAKDDANYQQWKDTEATDCKAAGMPTR